MTTVSDVRGRLVAFFARDLMGPAHGEDEILEERPSLRYSTAVLFPQATRRDESSEAAGVAMDGTEGDVSGDLAEPIVIEDADQTGADELDDEHDSVITLANTFKPSAMGFSFCAADVRALKFWVEAATYESLPGEHGRSRWARRPLALAPVSVLVSGPTGRPLDQELVAGLRLRVMLRSLADGTSLVTASVFNTTVETTRDAREFCQVSLRVRSDCGKEVFVEYRESGAAPLDEEEQSLALLYRSRSVFAAGHGCATDWSDPVDGRVAEIRSAAVPAVKVPPIIPMERFEPWTSMTRLSGAAPDDEILASLDDLPADYRRWIESMERELTTLQPRYRAAGVVHIAACRDAAARIERGIELLRRDPDALTAFKLMNAAMLRQQHHSRLRRKIDEPWSGLPEQYESVPERSGYWRVFQLAFVIMTLDGIGPDAELDSRELVDLIWFPTGGGKTEAYLGLAAYTMFRRRLARRSDGGCAILMRYTLRLLTSQQFQRAASLICACELIRRAQADRLGNMPFSIGLWVGSKLTPNSEKDALQKLNKLVRDDDAKNPFQLLSCPWCGTDMTNRKALGYVEERGRVVFRCPTAKTVRSATPCPFSKPGASLPVCVVDESIYTSPPTLLIGTVDKFAMLAWLPRARTLFGDTHNSPPELIIQDELHLISGPLGSMVGLYEGAIDLLCRDASGRRAKIVASTATIRRAAAQCRALFDRSTSQFPPPGLDASDSYFAREDSEADGRIYVGVLPTAASSPLTAQVRAVAGLIQGAPLVAEGCKPELLDPYWTLVQYFSSLKELGRAATLVSADIPEYLPPMQRRYGVARALARRINRAEEMTGRKNENDIPRILRELETRYTGPSDGSRKFAELPLDTLLATNMISVGVDVDRLGLMMVVTQPKGTSEYIQATSRVGRSRQAPGLIVTLYNAARPRDRSHYEQFRAYHEAFYRYVEPTSVTPYSVPALERGLHAVLVILARHVVGLTDPASFSSDNQKFKEGVDFIRARVARIDSTQLEAFEQWLARRIDEWERWAPAEWGDFSEPQDLFLMLPAGAPQPGGDFAGHQSYWRVPTSMRNVDAESVGTIVTYPGGN